MNYKDYIADIPDFPQDGILFRDVTPLMADGDVFKKACDEIIAFAKEVNAEVVVGPESRGFIFGCPVAYELGIGFVPVRKPGKLPRETVSVSYDLEYGTDKLEVHRDAIYEGDKVAIVDDLLATGGTVNAVAKLVEKNGGEITAMEFLIELTELGGRDVNKNYYINTLVQYDI